MLVYYYCPDVGSIVDFIQFSNGLFTFEIFICHLKYYLFSMIMLFVCVVTNVSLPQIGKQRKKAHVDLLKERKKKIQAAKESEEN